MNKTQAFALFTGIGLTLTTVFGGCTEKPGDDNRPETVTLTIATNGNSCGLEGLSAWSVLSDENLSKLEGKNVIVKFGCLEDMTNVSDALLKDLLNFLKKQKAKYGFIFEPGTMQLTPEQFNELDPAEIAEWAALGFTLVPKGQVITKATILRNQEMNALFPAGNAILPYISELSQGKGPR